MQIGRLIRNANSLDVVGKVKGPMLAKKSPHRYTDEQREHGHTQLGARAAHGMEHQRGTARYGSLMTPCVCAEEKNGTTSFSERNRDGMWQHNPHAAHFSKASRFAVPQDHNGPRTSHSRRKPFETGAGKEEAANLMG